jgi:hypothetical protein
MDRDWLGEAAGVGRAMWLVQSSNPEKSHKFPARTFDTHSKVDSIANHRTTDSTRMNDERRSTIERMTK